MQYIDLSHYSFTISLNLLRKTLSPRWSAAIPVEPVSLPIPGNDLDAVAGDGESVFDVDAGHGVLGDDGPVVVQDADVGAAHVDHRLDGQHQAFFQAEVLFFHFAGDEVGDLRAF